MLKHHYFILTLLFFWLTPINANTDATPPLVTSTPLEYAQQLNFHSNILNSTESLNIYLPSAFHETSDEHSYPVIFANDAHGSRFFLTLAGVVKHLGELDRMPESIVVSLNSGGHIPDLYKNTMWGGKPHEKIPAYGDPQKYIQHIQLELLPYLQKHYRASNYSTIIGISTSSIFPLYALTQQPDVFDAYVFLAAHDIIGMGYEAGDTLINAIKKIFSTPKPNTLLYFAVADNDAYREPIYTKNIEQFESTLGKLKKNGLHSKIQIFPNERHYDAFIKTLLGAFEMQFPEDDWAPKYRDLIALPGNAMDNIDAYYQQLSADYAVTVLPKGDRWNSVNSLRWISGQLQRETRIAEAIEVTQRWLKYRPKSQQAKEKLAELQNLL